MRTRPQIGKIVFFQWFLTHDPNPMTKIRFDNGNTVTIREGFV